MKNKEKRLQRRKELIDNITTLIGRVGIILLAYTVMFNTILYDWQYTNYWLNRFVLICLCTWVACPIANIMIILTKKNEKKY